MYNEVYWTCPHCHNLNEDQISQLVSGFGEFHLDSPRSIDDNHGNGTFLDILDRMEGSYCKSCGEKFNTTYFT
jgi:hypothetical protein